ncbi:addiction module protein [Uliginosibacterium sp. 31-12]|jgi:putative addiction module component (TIGR02574 family)|uniref:addiction module protein n=1 Tax=Uliginosibacterium sp. 31-12 TaxID=3062781 RepID=UPI0026E21D6F|nr:addiction module protein [Uliginosibacterium sp. 31-12]MDO6387970.1 addiction module protein [Uliginosibacterium sp. 31-12]
MTPSSLETIEATLMQLPQADRVHLAERLLASLDEEDEILTEWIAEAERRLDAMERGEVQGIPIEDALVQLRAGLNA